MRRKIRKIAVNPKQFNTLNEQSRSSQRTRVPRKVVSKIRVTSPPPQQSSNSPKANTNKSKFTITEDLYIRNEAFSNSIKSSKDKTLFFNELQNYSLKKYDALKQQGKPIINMVFFGHWGWVFSNMVEIYKKETAGKYTIISSVWPIPNCDVYQYWRIGNNISKQYLSKIGYHSKEHESFSRGIQMFHDSPYHESRFSTSFKKPFLGSYHSLLCTSKEQYDWVKNNKLHPRPYYVPLGVDERFKEKKSISSKQKIRLGFIGRTYGCGFKGEPRFVNLAKKLDTNKFEFLFLSPNSQKTVSQIRNLGFTVIEGSGSNKSFLDLYSSIDVTLILSINEGTPLPLIESLKHGHTVISTKVGEAPQHLSEEYLLDKRSPNIDKVVTLLNKIENDRSILEKNRIKNQQKVKNLTWKAYCNKSEKMWDDLIRAKKPAIKRKTHVTFLSWHNSLPGYIKNLYERLPLEKSFISVEHIKPPRLYDAQLMNRNNSYIEKGLPGLVKRLKGLGSTHVVVWNGEFNDNERGHQPKYIHYIKENTDAKIIYTEHGWLPQNKTFSIDLLGSNGSSSITQTKSIPSIDSPQYFSVVKPKQNEYKALSSAPNRKGYIYVPLQLNTDTQIVNHSPYFKDMKDFIQHIATLFDKENIVIKVHPKDTPHNKSRYANFCKNYSNVHFIDDMNGIGWCRYSDRVISINSTSINESLIFSKPVMTYGKNNFYGKGVTYEVKDISDRGYQKDFCKWSPNMNKLNNYLYYLLDRQFDKNNPDINKALMYFQ